MLDMRMDLLKKGGLQLQGEQIQLKSFLPCETAPKPRGLGAEGRIGCNHSGSAHSSSSLVTSHCISHNVGDRAA